MRFAGWRYNGRVRAPHAPLPIHYHCHVRPLADRVAKGLLGAIVIDPRAGRPDADELVMVMHGFGTNLDRAKMCVAPAA